MDTIEELGEATNKALGDGLDAWTWEEGVSDEHTSLMHLITRVTPHACQMDSIGRLGKIVGMNHSHNSENTQA